MPKLEALNDLTTLGSAVPTINDNFDKITTALNNTLSRDGSTPNSMSADLDMNSNDILNVNKISVQTFEIDGLNLEDYTNRVEEAAESVKNFTLFDSRANIVTYLQTQPVVTGRTYTAEGISYLGLVGATVIPDLPGLVPADVWTPLHFGCKGDGVTDDGALLNVALSAYKTAIETDADLLGSFVFDGFGKEYRSTVSLNWTHASSWGWQFNNMVIRSEATGKIAWDAIGSRGGSYRNFIVYGHETGTPAFGIVAARSAAGGREGFCDQVSYYTCGTRGFFSGAAAYFYGQESSNHTDCEWWNSHPDGYCGIVAGFDVLPITSDYVTPITGATSHINCNFTRTEFRQNPTRSANVLSFTSTNPLTVTLSSMPFSNGEVVVFGQMDAPSQLFNLKATITGVSGNTLTFGAVDATGWASLSGGGLCYPSSTKPALAIAGGLRGHSFQSCYLVAYGTDHVHWSLSASDTRQFTNIRMHDILCEGFGNSSNIRFIPGDRTMTIRDFTFNTWAARNRDAIFAIDVAGASTQVRFFTTTANFTTYMAPALPVMFSDESKFALYDSYIGTPQASAHSPVNHVAFRGRSFRHDTGTLENWAFDLVGDLDWRPSSGTRTKLNSRNTSGTVTGSLQFEQSSSTWGFSKDGVTNDYFMAPAAFYSNADNSYQNGLSTRRWSTGWFNVTNTNSLTLGGATTYTAGLGVGGTVTQLTNKSTAVTINTLQGTITTEATTSLAAGASAIFEVNNNLVTADTIVVTQVRSAATTYIAEVLSVSAGRFAIRLTNRSAGAWAQAVPITFALLAHTVTT